MKYSYLVGHNIKSIIKDVTGEHKYKGYVTKVSLNLNDEEIIYVKEDTGIVEWFFPCHPQIEILSLKITDTKYNRFEIMDI